MSNPTTIRRSLADAWTAWLESSPYPVPSAEVYALVASLRLLPPHLKVDADWELIAAWRMWQDDATLYRPPAYVVVAFHDWMRVHGLTPAPVAEMHRP